MQKFSYMERRFTDELTRNDVGKKVLLKGWVHDVRLLGKINFLILRDKGGKIQITLKKGEVGEDLMKLVKQMHQEDVIEVVGIVKESKQARRGIEIIPERIKVIVKSEVPLPLDPREVTPANLETKLNWRVLWFRTEEAKAIFSIQTEILKSFREFFLKHGFIEMQPPIIIASATEGGAELFPLPYFDKKAFLAQSPQLYKQMGAISFERVFMVTPVFRAEKFDQPTHLNEIRQMDVEIAFADDKEVMKWLEQVMVYILEKVKKNRKKELEVLGVNLKIPETPFPRITYEEAVKELKKKGERIEYGDDFTKSQERKLQEIFGEAFFLIDWPEELKPFYAMPKEDNPRLVKAFDLIYKGLEISSGTQRIHIPSLLEERIKAKGMDPKDFKFYIDAFRYGAPPHAGWSIGLERLTMKVCGKSNIKEVTMFPRTRERITP